MGKIKKTDSAAKTVEAWWALTFADGSLGQSILKWAPLMLSGGLMGGVVAWISSYGVAGWAATITIGVLATIWGMVGIAHLRSRQRIVDAPALDSAEIDAIVRQRLNDFLASTLRAEFATHAQMHAHDEKLIELAKQAADARTVANGAIEALDAARRQWDAWTHHHVQHNDHRFRSVDGGFRAIRDRERLLKLSTELTANAKWLLRSTEGEAVDDWGLWNHRHFEWRRAMTEYSQVATRYLPDIAQAINEVPTHTLKGEWPEDRSLFPSDDAMIEHRTTAVIMRNFGENHPKVIACVESFAFQAPSMKLIPDD
ncbi:hypothetical protein OVA07_14555 [Novosphingobium sp. SL115]|uniref:hypothetical protein n=1 Tax=Novosphingobium sp. SL115 TaxID=2995150 RepID=UPI00227642BA|nr:hypothetical protein [Novosphingobium sp. SL115]MCY1672224.1 hypothetical protein [Novosphingobium sp. SL115]